MTITKPLLRVLRGCLRLCRHLVMAVVSWLKDRADLTRLRQLERDNRYLIVELEVARREKAIAEQELELKTLSLHRMRQEMQADIAVSDKTIATGERSGR